MRGCDKGCKVSVTIFFLSLNKGGGEGNSLPFGRGGVALMAVVKVKVKVKVKVVMVTILPRTCVTFTAQSVR